MTREEIQKEAVEAWLKAGKVGVLAMTTGIGKSIISLHCVCTMPKGCKVLFLAETTQREKDIDVDIEKYKTLFGIDIKTDYQWEFMCYQSAYKLEDQHYGIVIGDEIHSGITFEYSKFFFNNGYDAFVGLSATVDRSTEYSQSDGAIITKGDILDQIAPICYKYTLNESQDNNTSRKLNIHILYHNLDATIRSVLAGTKAKPFQTTELAAYNYWDNEFKKALFLPANIKDFKIRNCATARAKVLYNMDSKVQVINKLLPHVTGKTIIFGNSLEGLLKVTPNVISGKNSDGKNSKIRDDFDSGKENLIGSFKMLKQGANLVDLDNVILMSYFSKPLDFIQQVGRLRVSDKCDGNVFFFITKGTVEQKWAAKIFEDLQSLNFIYHDNVDDLIKYLQK